MTDLNLTELRQDAGDYAKFQTDPLGSYEWDQRDVRAWQAADRIESLEAERDGLMVTNTHMLSYSQAAEKRVRELEARLARVTDEVNGYLDSLDDHITQDDFGKALATIRAVAADEQEATGEGRV